MNVKGKLWRRTLGIVLSLGVLQGCRTNQEQPSLFNRVMHPGTEHPVSYETPPKTLHDLKPGQHPCYYSKAIEAMGYHIQDIDVLQTHASDITKIKVSSPQGEAYTVVLTDPVEEPHVDKVEKIDIQPSGASQ